MAVTYSFTIDAVVSLVSATPTDYTVVRAVFSSPMKAVNPRNYDDALNPSNYLIEGGPRSLPVTRVDAVDSRTFDLSIPEMKNGSEYVLNVAHNVADAAGSHTVGDTAASDPSADHKDFTGLGDLPKVVSVTNPSPGILHIDFSEAMAKDARLLSPGSYAISPVASSHALMVESVSYDDSYPSRVSLKFRGGNSPYGIYVTGPTDLAGNPITVNSYLFDVTKPATDELYSGESKVFDTTLGAVKLSYSTLTERNIEDLAILRAASVGHQEQFDIISQALQEAGIDRDSRRLKFFKG